MNGAVTSLDPSMCLACARLREAGTCQAFPDGIPDEILRRGFDHRNAFPRDNGLRFVQADTEDAAASFAQWEEFGQPRTG